MAKKQSSTVAAGGRIHKLRIPELILGVLVAVVSVWILAWVGPDATKSASSTVIVNPPGPEPSRRVVPAEARPRLPTPAVAQPPEITRSAPQRGDRTADAAPAAPIRALPAPAAVPTGPCSGSVSSNNQSGGQAALCIENRGDRDGSAEAS